MKKNTKAVKKQEPIVFIDGSKIVTDSLLVACEFDKRHDVVIRKIENTIKRNEKLKITGHIFGVSKYKDHSGKWNKKYLLNRDAFLEIAMSFTGDRAAQLRNVFIKAFNKLETFANRKKYNQDYIKTRHEGKIIRHKETDALAILKEYGRECGASNGFLNNIYSGYTRMSNKALFIIQKGVKHKNVKEELNTDQLRIVAVAEIVIRDLVLEQIKLKADYHYIYYLVKDKIKDFAELIGKTEVPSFQIENKNQAQLSLF